MKALIVDDEKMARESLCILLAAQYPEMEIVGQVTNVPEAVKAIGRHKPDLLFLDVNMPGQDGFQLLDYFDEPAFQIIFTTSFPEYALKAFEVAALAYLLKPIRESHLKPAVERAIKLIGQANISQQINLLKETWDTNHVHKIALPVAGKVFFVKVADIIYLQADNVYTHVITKDQKFLLSTPLKGFAYLLNEDSHFFRVHRSYIINLQQVKQYSRQDGFSVMMENGDTLPLSKERKPAFELLIKALLINQTFRI